MRFFSLLDFQYVVLLVCLGIAFLIALYLAFTHENKDEGEEMREAHPEAIREQDGPVPLVLMFLYLGFIIWAIVYVVIIGIRGKPL
jgi:predicted RND superfamily exporter protein